jgi:hypothetical protein
MGTDGIEGLYIETHNWGKTVAFWQGLGFDLEFETDHHSGLLRHPAGGPYIFLAEHPETHALETHPILHVADAKSFTPPDGTVTQPFEAQHWGMLEMRLADADGRAVSLQAPPPA